MPQRDSQIDLEVMDHAQYVLNREKNKKGE